MQAEKPQAQAVNGSVGELWRRAPAFRRLVYLAATASLAGAIAFSLNSGSATTLEASRGEPAKAEPRPVVPTSSASQEALPLPQKTAQSYASEPIPLPIPKPGVADQGAAFAGDEDAQRARCHPHLIPGSAAMPQIDVSQMPDPSLGHIKVHFWVNGAGLVSREVLTATTYATAAERQAELEFTKGLTFTVPNTAECRVREMELIGDFFEMRNAAGQWATFVKLYPRLSFDTDGVVRSRE